MAAIRHRMCQADRDQYGDPPKAVDGWVVFDLDALAEMRGTELEAIEATTGFRVTGFWLPSQRISARGQRAALWVARKLAGAVDPWDTFDPHIMQVESEPVAANPAAEGGDADPPASGSAGGSTDGG